MEELAPGRHRLVTGERRLRAAKWGAAAHPDEPHFAAIPAVVCPGPLSEEDRRTWQLVENLAREDLRPGELAAALCFERCAVLAAKLLAAGTPVPAEVLALDDPVGRFRALERLRGRDSAASAPWGEVLRRLGIQLSPRQARALVAAFAALPPDLSADFDAHQVALATRQAYLRLDAGRGAAAAELWAAVKARGRPGLLGAAARECLGHPGLPPAEALGRAEALHQRANQARALRLRARGTTPAPEPGAGPPPVPGEVVASALGTLRDLLGHLRAGRRPAPYEAGSLRLYAAELSDLLDSAPTPPADGRDPSGVAS